MSVIEQALGNVGVTQGNLGLVKDQLQQFIKTQGKDFPMIDGSQPLVICGGIVEQVEDLAAAQRVAEERAHQRNAEAYILKPVTRVALKRDVVTTELPDKVGAVPSVVPKRRRKKRAR